MCHKGCAGNVVKRAWASQPDWAAAFIVGALALLTMPILRAADHHEGVASCAGGTCHGSTRPLGNSGIRQDEYFIWQQKDPHAGAYRVLYNERSNRIGQRLGIQPASASQCLACHADNTAAADRGERFLVSDGIACEVCHGGSQRWLSEHARPGITLEEKAALGMTATWQPATRAAVCLTCHQGDAGHPITHAMMAAGHPPLLFELDTFTALQPPHYDRDADYAQRKGVRDAARDWAVGQAVAAEQFLTQLAEAPASASVFPELANFDCNACHHSLNAGRWLPGRTGALPPGAPPLADSHLYWLGVWLDIANPEQGAAWQAQWLKLQDAMAQGPGALRAAAQSARAQLKAHILPAASRASDPAQVRKLLRAIAATASTPRAQDFSAAEQAAMASLVLSDSLSASGQPLSKEGGKAVDLLYAAVRSRDRFNPAQYHLALQALNRALN